MLARRLDHENPQREAGTRVSFPAGPPCANGLNIACIIFDPSGISKPQPSTNLSPSSRKEVSTSNHPPPVVNTETLLVHTWFPTLWNAWLRTEMSPRRHGSSRSNCLVAHNRFNDRRLIPDHATAPELARQLKWMFQKVQRVSASNRHSSNPSSKGETL